MSKYLTKEETEEIVNAIFAEVDYCPVKIYWDGREWCACQIVPKQRRFLWWKWVAHTKEKRPLLSRSTLVSLIEAAEEKVKVAIKQKEIQDRAREEEAKATEAIRRRHADKLLDKKLEN